MSRTIHSASLQIVLAGFLAAGVAYPQAALVDPNPPDSPSKLHFHLVNTFGPEPLAGSAAYAAFLQQRNSPREWGQGAGAYGERLASTLAYVAVRNTLAFGLDSALHQDPRYYRSGTGGFWHRTGHAIRGTILTRTDSGSETLSTWRLGSAYGASFLANEWHPGRVNTIRGGFSQGSTQIAFDALQNLRAEFWPDMKNRMFHHRP